MIKVSDFGLSEDVYARNYFRQGKLGEEGGDQVKLPVRWMALESLNDGVFTEKTDVVRGHALTDQFFFCTPKFPATLQSNYGYISYTFALSILITEQTSRVSEMCRKFVLRNDWEIE